MKAAPYTRETLQRIRNGASAADLGWQASFYESVCLRHEIQPVKVTVKAVALVAARPYTPPVRREPLPTTQGRRRLAMPKPRPDGGTFAYPLNGRVDEEMARAVFEFAKKSRISMLEAQRQLIQAGLDAFSVEGDR